MHPLAMAAMTIAATLFITYYAFNEGLPFVHHFTLNAVVNNSVAVRSSSPVRIAGVDVGVVTGVSADGDASRIRFTLEDNGQPVHSDATLRIRPRVFLEGGYYLELDPGSPSAQGRRHDSAGPNPDSGPVLQHPLDVRLGYACRPPEGAVHVRRGARPLRHHHRPAAAR
jgi:ABC-type transporter Mla subunit MlaD